MSDQEGSSCAGPGQPPSYMAEAFAAITEDGDWREPLRNRDANDDFVEHGPQSVRDAIGRASKPGDAQKGSAPLPFKWFADIRPNLQGMWLVKRLLPATGLALIYGHPGCGKSFFALDLSLHIALGWDWAGRKTKPGLVIYVGAEGGPGLENRITAFRLHHALEEELPFALIPTPIDLQDPGADTIKLVEQIRFLVAVCGAQPVLIVVDTLSKTFGAGKENTDDMASYIANCQRVASMFDCLVMPVHHRPKDADSIEPRGHGSLKGGVDTVILVEGGKTKSAEVTKQKDGEIGERFLFNLNVIELGQDEDGDPVTSCTVDLTEKDLNPKLDPFAQAVSKLSKGHRFGYDVLGDVIETDGLAVPASIPATEIDRERVGKVAGLEEWRARFLARQGVAVSASGDNSENEGGDKRGQRGDKDYERARKAFDRAREALQEKGIARIWGEYAWITHSILGTSGDKVGDIDRGRAGTRGQRGHGSLDPVHLSPDQAGRADSEDW